jgi:hypothetical protein
MLYMVGYQGVVIEQYDVERQRGEEARFVPPCTHRPKPKDFHDIALSSFFQVPKTKAVPKALQPLFDLLDVVEYTS